MKYLNQIKQLYVNSKFIGVPFKWEGRDLTGTDCIGLSWMFLKDNGILKTDSDGLRYSDGWEKEDPERLMKNLIRVGKRKDKIEELEPLDIVVFKVKGIICHIGIYLGYGKFLHIHIHTKSAIGSLYRWEKYFYCGISPVETGYNNESLYAEVKDKKIGVPAVAAVLASIGAAIGVTGTGLAITLANVIVGTVVSFAISAIATALAPKPAKPNFGEGGSAEGSVRYGFGALQNTASSELPVPVLYGELKLAGNAIYQSDPGETISRADLLCEGEVNSITDVRVNDIPIAELEGCSYIAYYGTTSQNVDSRFSNRVPGLRNISYLALTLQTSDKLQGGFPTITCLVQGTKIETWDGNKWVSTRTYSNNPAACVRDFLTNVRYGVGLPSTLLEESSFGEVYDYCNVLVDTNVGGTEKRYTLNYILDSKKPAVDILNEMLSVFGGVLVWSGNKLKLRVDKTENVVQNFTMSNIVEKSFSYSYVSRDDMANRIKILYIDPNQNYTKVYAIAEDKTMQDDRMTIDGGGDGIVLQEVSALGITKFSQASRLANLALKASKSTPIMCQFKAGILAIHCEPMDVITISHDVPNWTNKLFRIISISEEPNDEMSITCREYNSSIYDDSYGSSIVNYQYGTAPNYLKNTVDATNIILTEVGWRNEDGTHIASIDVSWTAPSSKDYLTGYYLEWNKDSAGYVYATKAEIGATSVRIPNAVVGSSYVIKMQTVNYYGIKSSGVTSSTISIVGKDANPSSVQNFIVNQFRDSLSFQWDKITVDPDISHYEIKDGASWEVGTTIGKLLTENTWTYKAIKNGTATYWVKAVDRSGNYSTTATSVSITVSNIPFQNAVYTSDEHTAWSGNKINLTKTGDSLYINTGFLSGDYYTDWKDVGKVVVARIGYKYSSAISGDIAWDSDASLAFDTHDDLRFNGFDAPTNITFYVQTSGDSGASGDWTLWQFADYEFRYFRTKATLQRSDVGQTTSLSTLTSEVDVPDVDEWGPDDGTYTFCPAAGKSVTFEKTFYYAPEVAIMVYPSGGIVRTPEVEATTTGFTVTLRDKTDTAVNGNFRWHSHGY